MDLEEHKFGDAVWIALRARGSQWSWMTPEEATELARKLLERYAPKE